MVCRVNTNFCLVIHMWSLQGAQCMWTFKFWNLSSLSFGKTVKLCEHTRIVSHCFSILQFLDQHLECYVIPCLGKGRFWYTCIWAQHLSSIQTPFELSKKTIWLTIYGIWQLLGLRFNCDTYASGLVPWTFLILCEDDHN